MLKVARIAIASLLVALSLPQGLFCSIRCREQRGVAAKQEAATSSRAITVHHTCGQSERRSASHTLRASDCGKNGTSCVRPATPGEAPRVAFNLAVIAPSSTPTNQLNSLASSDPELRLSPDVSPAMPLVHLRV